jgi:hydrogenase/urease accessory protein HupE
MALAVFVFLCAQMAFSHPQKGEAIGFLTGLRHPISGLDHVLAMVAGGCGVRNSVLRRSGFCRLRFQW